MKGHLVEHEGTASLPEQLAVAQASASASAQRALNPISRQLRTWLDRSAHCNIREFLQDQRADERARTCGVDVGNASTQEHPAQDKSETPLTQENCTGCPVLLLCPFLFQFLRKSGMCTPFCLHHHRVGQKFH